MEYIIGIGTGRCGSQSLSKLFYSQERIISFHEIYWSVTGTTFRDMHPILSIVDEDMPKKYLSCLDYFESKYSKYSDYIFDIGPYTKIASKLINSKKNTKFIILKRNFDDFKKA